MELTETTWFWLLLLVVNTFYFIPRYVLDYSTSSFLPIKGLMRGSARQRMRWILVRLNYDIFRLAGDLFIVLVIYVLFLRDFINPEVAFAIIWLLFAITLIYQVYFTLFHKIYKVEPVLFNDVFVLKTAFLIFMHDFRLKNLLIVIFAMVLGVLSLLLVYYLVLFASVAQFGMLSFLVTGLATVGIIFSLRAYDYIQMPLCTFQSQVASLIANIRLSLKARTEVRSLTLQEMKRYNIDGELALTYKPNIHFIVIESYGRIVCEDPELQADYQSYTRQFNDDLRKQGWDASSCFTVSPVVGGGSWLSYTTLLYGLRVNGQGLFLTLMKNEYIDQYDSLFHWLKKQGYITYRLSSLGGYEKMEIPYDRYSRLYGIDHWIKYRDLDYRGREYGFGPSPPDQYSLNCARSRITESGEAPFALFFITQNSHTPYDSPQEVSGDWRSLCAEEGDVQQESKFWTRPRLEKYGGAIKYQMSYLMDYIQNGSEHDVYILIGDHQPPSFRKEINNFETPCHIISRNSLFNESVREHGLHQGLCLDLASNVTGQEAIRSILIRSLLMASDSNNRLPPFLQNGIPVSYGEKQN